MQFKKSFRDSKEFRWNFDVVLKFDKQNLENYKLLVKPLNLNILII